MTNVLEIQTYPVIIQDKILIENQILKKDNKILAIMLITITSVIGTMILIHYYDESHFKK